MPNPIPWASFKRNLFRHYYAIQFCLAVSFLSGAICPARGQFEEMTSRSFAVHFRTVKEFIPLATAVISNKGTVTPNTSMNVMVIRDYPSNLDKVDSLLARFDQPLHQVRIITQLVFGSNVADEELMLAYPQIDHLLADRYSFNRLELIDKGIIITEETSPTTFNLAGGDFAISFMPAYLPLLPPRVELRDFVITSIRKALAGEERRRLLTSSVSMAHGEEQIVGAMKFGNQGETLLVILRMEILGEK